MYYISFFEAKNRISSDLSSLSHKNYYKSKLILKRLTSQLSGLHKAFAKKETFFHVFTKSAIFFSDNTEKIELSPSSLLNCHLNHRTKSEIKCLK